MRAKAAAQEEIRKSIVDLDDDATRSSSCGGSSDAQRQIDLSLLRKPILTAVTGFMEAHKAYDAGTEEIRKLLTNECDVMYECRVCRNIFRSLTNFISHKRVYCRKLFDAAQNFHFQNDGFWDEDITTIVQAEKDSLRKAKKANADILNKDLTSIVERLRRKQHQLSSEINLTDYYDKINHKLSIGDLNQQQHLLRLDQVPNSQVAVYQTVRSTDDTLAEVNELDKLANNNNNSVLGPDGKVLGASSRPQSTLPIIGNPSNRYLQPIQLESNEDRSDRSTNSENVQGYSCSECNLQFDTEKTLLVHIEKRHTPSAYVYVCPCCSAVYMQCNHVINHLVTDHKKSLRKARQMRDSIISRVVRADEVVVKGPSRELARLQQSSTTSSNRSNSTTHNGYSEEHDEAAATRAWMENLEHFDQGPMCSYCGKTFERKAVLTTHMQTCVQKIRHSENGSGSVPPASSSTSSGRRSKVKSESPLTVKIKQEPPDAACSDDSNSYDVPLSRLQARLNQETKKDHEKRVDDSNAQVNRVVTVKPEELSVPNDSEACSRRKRKKPMIMLRNATDDISWDIDDSKQDTVQENSLVIKQEPEDIAGVENQKIKKPLKPRRKKTDGKEEIDEREMLTKMEQQGEIDCRCGKKFNDPEQYKRHLRVFHRRQKRFWCAICNFKGYRKVDAVNHLIQEHEYKGSSDDICALINVQPIEKSKKSAGNISEPIKSVIEAVSRNCDTSATDISFLESTIESLTINTSPSKDNSTMEASMLSTAAADSVTEFSNGVYEIEKNNTSAIEDTALAESDSPKKRRRPGAFRHSICSSTPQAASKSNDIEEDSSSPTSKRPVRNRIKPVDKDFVYDLTHLLHKEEDLEDFPLPELMQEKPSLTCKIKTESSRISSASPEKRESKKESLRSHAPKPKPSIPPEVFRGAAYKMAKHKVDEGLAAFYRRPDIPAERSFIPTKMSPQTQKQHIAQRRVTTIHDWPVVKKERKLGSITKQHSDIQIHRKYTKRASSIVSTTVPDLFREQRKTIPRRNSVGPLRQKLSASLEILNKLNASRSAAGLETVQLTAVKCPSEAEFKRYLEAKLRDYRKTMAQVNLNGTTVEDVSNDSPPRKRITLMQRLQENRNKRIKEQNQTTPTSKDRTSSAETTPSSASRSVSEILHAKLKRFSSF